MIDRDIPQIGVDIHTPDFQGLAKAMGCHAAKVSNLGALAEALKEAANSRIPSLIEVVESDLVGGPPKLAG